LVLGYCTRHLVVVVERSQPRRVDDDDVGCAHSTPELAAKIYTKPAATDLRAALDRASGLLWLATRRATGRLRVPLNARSRGIPKNRARGAYSAEDRAAWHPLAPGEMVEMRGLEPLAS
jgi:hypothetical protein